MTHEQFFYLFFFFLHFYISKTVLMYIVMFATRLISEETLKSSKTLQPEIKSTFESDEKKIENRNETNVNINAFFSSFTSYLDIVLLEEWLWLIRRGWYAIKQWKQTKLTDILTTS